MNHPPVARRDTIVLMPARLAKLSVQPGEYAVEWFLDERVIPGEFGMGPDRPPVAVVFGVLVRDWSRGGGFPEDHTFGRVAGHPIKSVSLRAEADRGSTASSQSK